MGDSQQNRPACEGAPPVRTESLPLFAPVITEEGIAAVERVLRSGWLATGPLVSDFETAFADTVGGAHAVAVTSGSIALELALEGLGVGAGDEVITTPLTFAATAHAIMNRGATPVLVDIDPLRWTLDPDQVESAITERTRAVLPVHFAGRPCDMTRIVALAEARGLAVLSDCAHAIESECEARNLGGWGSANAYSFHPCKTLTTGEGGMVVTDDPDLADRVRRSRFHGLVPAPPGSGWMRDVTGPGHKANMSNIQAALGIEQLRVLDERYAHRCALVERYRSALAAIEALTVPPVCPAGDRHAWHLFNVLLNPERLRIDRETLIRAMADENIEVGIHYRPLHCLTYLQERLGVDETTCPVATDVGSRSLSLPLHAAMSVGDVDGVAAALQRLETYYGS